MQPKPSRVVFVGSSQYGTYRVVDMTYNDRPARVLFGAGSSAQSGMTRDGDPEPLFEYNQRFLEIMLSQVPRRALVIGGGVLMLPKAAYELFPKLTIDVVEIDALLLEVASEYFDVPRDKRLRTHVADGLEFVKSSKANYDTIIIDAFDGHTVPPHLVDTEAAWHYKKTLSKKGIVAINFISEYKTGQPSLASDIVNNFSRSFAHVKLYQVDSEYDLDREQNMLLVASNAELTLDYLQAEEVRIVSK